MSLNYQILSERNHAEKEPMSRRLSDYSDRDARIRVLFFLLVFPVLFLLLYAAAWFLVPLALAEAWRGVLHAIDMRLSGH